MKKQLIFIMFSMTSSIILEASGAEPYTERKARQFRENAAKAAAQGGGVPTPGPAPISCVGLAEGQIGALKLTPGRKIQGTDGVTYYWDSTTNRVQPVFPASTGGGRLTLEPLLAAMSLSCHAMSLCCHGLVAERAIDVVGDETVQEQRRVMVNANFSDALTAVKQAMSILEASVHGNE